MRMLRPAFLVRGEMLPLLIDLSSYCLRSVSEHVGKAVNQRFWNGNLIVSARNIQEIHKG